MIVLWLIVDERTASAKDRRSINDPAVSGAAPIESRPGFAALLDRVENNGVRVVLVEDASRFARDLVAQELGVLMLNQARYEGDHGVRRRSDRCYRSEPYHDEC